MRFCLGVCAQANEVSDRSQPLRTNGFVEAIRSQINAEAEVDWTVEPPIDVLQLDSSGPRWIGRSHNPGAHL